MVKNLRMVKKSAVLGMLNDQNFDKARIVKKKLECRNGKYVPEC